MQLSIFDLDWTLFDGDTGFEWPRFLAEIGVLDSDECEASINRLDAETRAGTLIMEDYLRFQLDPLSGRTTEQALAWRTRYLRERARSRIKPGARALVREHLKRTEWVVIITGTSRFVAEPIANELGVHFLIATEAEAIDGHYTGRMEGVACFREGKVEKLSQWMEKHGLAWKNVSESYFFSDSGNDIPLLSRVTHPVAVDPDSRLRQHAEVCGWEVISLL